MAKGLDAKLDRLWSLIIKKKAENKCEKCGKTQHLNSHHVFGRRNKSVRWEITNGCCLCPACHTFSSTFSAHQTPTSFTQWIIGQRSEEWHDELMLMANTPKKWSKFDKEELLKEFQECLTGGE